MSIWNGRFFKCLIDICLDPDRVGFSLNDLEVYTNLPVKTKQFLKLITQNLPKHIIDFLKQKCIELIDEKKEYSEVMNYVDVIRSNTAKIQIDWPKLSQLINGYEQLGELKLYHFSVDLNRALFEHLLNHSEIIQSESQTCTEAKRKLLNLTISLNFNRLQSSADDYLIQIIDKYLFTGAKEFFQYYRNEIFYWICRRHEHIIKYILSKLNLNFFKSVTLISHIIEYLGTEKNLRKSFGTKLVNFVYESWPMFKEAWQSNDVDKKLALIGLLTKSLIIESFKANSVHLKSIAEMYMTFLVDKA